MATCAGHTKSSLVRLVALFLLLALVAARASAGNVKLAWDPPTGPVPAGYKVYYGPAAGNYPSSVDVGSTTSYTVSGLTEGATYHFAAADYDVSHTESGFSNDVSAMVPYSTPVASFSASTTTGAAPLALNFLNASTGTITSYAWSFGDGTTSTAASPSHVYAAAGVYTVSLTVTGPGGSNAKTKANYITVSATTDITPPTTPGNPVATPVGSTAINLTWTASTDNVGVTGYLVERCQGATCTTFAQIGAPTGTSYSNSGLSPSATYRYRVRARDAAGNISAYSAIVSATTTTATADTTPPTVSIASPTGGSTVSGTVPVSVTATDNLGVTKVELRVNGTTLASDTVAPYQFSWDSTKVANGSATLTAVAYDAVGHSTVSAGVALNVSNTAGAKLSAVWVEDAVPVGATLGGNESWSWVSSNPAPYSGALTHQSALFSGLHQHYFTNATAKLSVAVGDTLFAYVYLDPANPPSEVMLQWNDGSWEHRAYWGVDLVGFGTNGTGSRRYMGPLPAPGQWVRLAAPASQVGLEGHTLTGMAYTLYNGRATWDYAGKVSATAAVWVEDAVPVGATLGGNESWSWVSSNPAPYSGALTHQSALFSGLHQHYFTNATAKLSVAVGDTLFAYVYLDPANPPSEVMLQWNDGSWEHRAYWGADLVGFGTNGTGSRRYMGPLPAPGQWVRLAAPASQVGLEGHTLTGMAYTLYNGRATWDYAGK